MIGVALKGLLGRKLRATLTAFAIVLGVAMISGSFILTDTLSKSFDGIYEESYKSTDAVVTSKVAIKTADGDSEAPAFSAGVLARSPTCPASRDAQGSIEDKARLSTRPASRSARSTTGSRSALDTSADQSLNPLKLVDGRVAARRRRDRDRQVDRREAGTSQIGQTVGASPTARCDSTGSPASSASAPSTRSAARRSRSSTSRPAACVRQGRASST